MLQPTSPPVTPRLFPLSTELSRNQIVHELDEVAALRLSGSVSTSQAEVRLLGLLAERPDEEEIYWHLAQLYLSGSTVEQAGKLVRLAWEQAGERHPRARAFVEDLLAAPSYGIETLPAELRARGALLLSFSDDLSTLDLVEVQAASHQFLGRVHGPQLACSPRDLEGLPAHRRTVIEDWIKRGKGHRLVRHRGITVECHQSVFGPAVDTLFFNAVLRDTLAQRPDLCGAMRVLELGCGSGMLLSSLVAALGPQVQEITAIDVEPSARLLTARNLARTIGQVYPGNLPFPAMRLLNEAAALHSLPSGSVDFWLLNPPYLPSELPHTDTPNPIEGTDLIRELLVGEGPRVLAPGGCALLLYSSLCAGEFATYAAQTPLQLERVAAPRRVPLDLAEVARDPRWMRYLRARGGLEERLNDSCYPYWHSLHMVLLRAPGGA